MPGTIDAFFKPKPPSETLVAARPTPLASKPDEKAPDVDKEQDFIDFFAKIAKNPNCRGKKMNSRRVAVFGKRYYWGEDVSFPIDKLPFSFRQWCASNKYTGYNSILVNLYEDKKDYIGWHCDDVSNLADGEVVSVSFALHKGDRNKVLSKLEFRWTAKDGGNVVKSEDLTHGSVVRFDAKKHKKKRCEHRVAKTLFPRVNVTMRKLKI